MGCKRQASAAAPTLTFVCVETGSGDMLQVLPSGAMGQMALEVVELHLSANLVCGPVTDGEAHSICHGAQY